MKAIRVHKPGGPEALQYEEAPDPRPESGEVLIRVEAAGVNFADTLARAIESRPLGLATVDAADMEVFNHILWQTIEGDRSPIPDHRARQTGGWKCCLRTRTS